MKPATFFVLWAAALGAQAPVNVTVDLAAPQGPWKPVWAFFGHDEPNYTYMKDGRKLLGELAALSPVPVYIRTHNLLTSGDGTPALKWGSTNAYTEDAAGRPVYDWRIMDRIFDTYRDTGVKPLVEIGFMPEALSVKPQPYQHTFPKGSIWTGWAHPPKDYAKWAALVEAWVRHAVERYGAREVATWYWEVWNEPDIGYWQGTPEEYNKLYDYAADAVKRALPAARIGGPHTTGASAPKAAAYLRGFLEHVLRGTNYATGKRGSPLDFVAFHAKGNPRVIDGRVHMGIRKEAQDVGQGFAVIASFPELKNKPVILGEWDPEGCAACSARAYPNNAYRNGTMYSSYTAAMLRHTLDLADRHGVRLEGALTWAFEFEDQPWFDGFRSLSTNGVAKPVLNVFRMLGLMSGERVKLESSGATGLDNVLKDGVRQKPDINGLAARTPREASILLWNYHDIEQPAAEAPVALAITGLPASVTQVQVRHYRIDHTHSNAYTAWQRMGSPQSPTPEQYAQLESAGRLELLASPEWRRVSGGKITLNFPLPWQAVSLVQVSW